MSDLTRPSSRTRIDVAEAAEIARMAGPLDPNLVPRDELEDRLGASALILDGLRRRPRYFDGRFLTGADLTRDQDYIRQRQADLARASGTGVVAGLQVSGGSDPRGESLVLEPGHGITPDGQLVMVERRRQIPLLDLPEARRLNATLGLRREPRAPLGRRTGLFVVALRPVEFTANPIAAYPTSISGARQIEDGDIVEATAVVLVPYPGGGVGTLSEARRLVAREIFLGEPKGLPEDVLPLAMLALDRGALAWIDAGMVRRETGADTPLQVSMGARPRALSEAFVLQHQEHVADVIRERRAAGLPDAFAAAQSFAALPPAGQVPAATIQPVADGFLQLWFPPAVDVELTFAPADEIAALVEESLALPPIDLGADAEELDATSVVVIAPVTRPRLQRFAAGLRRLSVRAESGPTLNVRRAPAAELSAMLARRRLPALAPRPAPGSALTEAETAELKAWQAAWGEAVAALPSSRAEAPMLWYVRRRSLPQHSAVVGVAVPITGDEGRSETVLEERLGELGLRTRLDAVNRAATPAATARITGFLATPRIARSDVMLAAAVHELEAALPGAATTPTSRVPVIHEPNLRERLVAGPIGARDLERIGRARLEFSRVRLDRRVPDDPARPRRLSDADVIDIASDFATADLGDGIARVEKAADGEFKGKPAVWLGDTGRALEVDRLGLRLDGDRLRGFAGRVAGFVKARDAESLVKLITEVQG